MKQKRDCFNLAAKHGIKIVLPPGGYVYGDIVIEINLPDGYLTDENTTGYSLFFNPKDHKMSVIWNSIYEDIQKLIAQKPWALEKIEVGV